MIPTTTSPAAESPSQMKTNHGIEQANINAFVYQPLQDTRTIRIIWLQPLATKDTASDVQIHLDEAFLDNCPSFEALSYTWDDQQPDVQNTCCGKALLVTKNCHSILCGLRRREPRALWIDAICIDQSSTVERNNQVRLMGDIYRKADKVLIWPGDCDFKTRNLVFHLYLSWLHETHADKFKKLDQEYKKSQSQTYGEEIVNSFIHEFFSRPWFSRMWTMQEVILPRDRENIYMIVGEELFSYRYFLYAATKYEDHPRSALAQDAAMLDIYQGLLYKTSSVEQLKEYPKYDIFSELRRKKCSNPKDKVFALYGILQLIDPDFPKPDYSRDVIDIYTEAAIWTLVKMNHLKMLYYSFSLPCELPKSQLGLDKYRLPSWVPDFTIPPTGPESGMNAFIGKSHNATLNSPARCKLLPGAKLLMVRGKLLGHIKRVGNSMIDSTGVFLDSKAYIAEAFRIMVEWFYFLHFDPSTIEEVFHTLMARWSKFRLERTALKACVRAFIQSGAYRRKFLYPDKEFETNEIDPELEAVPLFLTKSNEGRENVQSAWLNICGVLDGWRCFTTKTGEIGFGVGDLKEDDRVALISGLELPLVLRPTSDGNWKLIGYTYVHGIMDGELWPRDEAELKEVILA